MTSRLILRSNDRETITARRSTDQRTALTRGLADYLRTLSVVFGVGGRLLKFESVHDVWAEPEAPKVIYPAAHIYTPNPVRANEAPDAPLSPQLNPANVLDDGTYWSVVGEVASELSVELWCTDPVQLMGLVSMLEDALMPVDWMSGARIELPHYHGVRARYLRTSTAYLDVEGDAATRQRKAVIEVLASMPAIRLFGKRAAFNGSVRLDLDPDPADT